MNKTWIGHELEMTRKWLAIQAQSFIYYCTPFINHFFGICGVAPFPIDLGFETNSF